MRSILNKLIKAGFQFVLAFSLFSLALSALSKAKNLPDEVKWKFHVDFSSFSCYPAIGQDGTIYIAGDDLYAINPDGSLKWTTHIRHSTSSYPVIAQDGTIYVTDSDRLYAINPDGSLKWVVNFDISFIRGSLAIDQDGTIYAAVGNRLYAINPNGSPKWMAILSEIYSVSPPVIAKDGTIYVGFGNNFSAISRDGILKWKIRLREWAHASIMGHPETRERDALYEYSAIAQDGTIYVTAGESLFAINSNGRVKWKIYLGSRLSYPVIAQDGTIYVGGCCYLYAVSPKGSLKWKLFIRTRYSGSQLFPVIAKDGTIYVAAEYNICAVNPDGKLKWSIYIKHELHIPILDQSGTIYVCSENNSLFAIYSTSNGLANSPWPAHQHDVRHTGRAEVTISPTISEH